METTAVNAIQESRQPSTVNRQLYQQQLGQGEFLRLLVTQLRSQDPLQPMTNTEFLSQMAQFSALQASQDLNAAFRDFARAQLVTQAAALVGRQVAGVDPQTGQPFEGAVTAVKFTDGTLHVIVDNTDISAANIMVVGR